MLQEQDPGRVDRPSSRCELPPPSTPELALIRLTSYSGLSPFAAWITLASSHLLITGLIVLNGRGPARYHVCPLPFALLFSSLY